MPVHSAYLITFCDVCTITSLSFEMFRGAWRSVNVLSDSYSRNGLTGNEIRYSLHVTSSNQVNSTKSY